MQDLMLTGSTRKKFRICSPETKRMKQGTVSVLFGCHNIVHSLYVLWAWVILYDARPKWWQFICIMIHDVGHWGKQYLDDEKQKAEHWMLGARWAKKLYGQKGYDFVAGHTSQSGCILSMLHKADKYAWYITPTWVIWLNALIEPKLRMGYTRIEGARRFKEQVRKTIESGEYGSVHKMYMERCIEANKITGGK